MFRKTEGFILSLFFLLSGCTNMLNRDEADRSLKVMNSNLVNFFTAASEKPEIQALHFLLNEPSSPLALTQKEKRPSPDAIAKTKGIFEWNTESGLFLKKDSTQQLTMNFPANGKDGENVRFVLSDFETRDCKNRPEFPVAISANLFIEGVEKLEISHHATIQDDLPLEISSSVSGDRYSGTLKTNRTRQGNSGTLNIEIDIRSNGFSVCSAAIDAKIEYSRQGYYFRHFDFKLNLFEHRITGKLDYSKIDPTTSDYVKSFNRYSSIVITENNGNKVGNIVLRKSVNEELLDYFVRFSNGEEVLLSSYIPMIKKVLDFKY